MIADASMGAGFYDEWDPGDPREQYSAVDRSTLFVPADLVGIVRCPKCGDDYANSAFLSAHVARDHAAASTARVPRAPERPAGVPEAVRPQDVLPEQDESRSTPLRPVPEVSEPQRTVVRTTSTSARAARRGAGRYSHTNRSRDLRDQREQEE